MRQFTSAHHPPLAQQGCPPGAIHCPIRPSLPPVAQRPLPRRPWVTPPPPWTRRPVPSLTLPLLLVHPREYIEMIRDAAPAEDQRQMERVVSSAEYLAENLAFDLVCRTARRFPSFAPKVSQLVSGSVSERELIDRSVGCAFAQKLRTELRCDVAGGGGMLEEAVDQAVAVEVTFLLENRFRAGVVGVAVEVESLA